MWLAVLPLLLPSAATPKSLHLQRVRALSLSVPWYTGGMKYSDQFTPVRQTWWQVSHASIAVREVVVTGLMDTFLGLRIRIKDTGWALAQPEDLRSTRFFRSKEEAVAWKHQQLVDRLQHLRSEASRVEEALTQLVEKHGLTENLEKK